MQIMSTGNEDENIVAVDAIIDFQNQLTEFDNTEYNDDCSRISENLITDTSPFYPDLHIKQYVHSVLDFSSQYGTDLSISYTAQNITGRPSKFPEYGDFPQTFAMRTYGDWWNKAPSHFNEIQPQNLPEIDAEDFIVVHFEEFVIPEEIVIFETFNPGAVVRIWAYTIVKNWICLWENQDFYKMPSYNANKARRFSPPLKQTHFPTKTIRLEFNHQLLNYYTQIDAILLCGKKFNIQNMQRLLDYCDRQQKGSKSILGKLQTIKFRPITQNDYQKSLQHFLMYDLNKFIDVLKDTTPKLQNNSNGINIRNKIGIKDMPFDIMLKIFSYLDLKSLCRISQVSKYCYNTSIHPLLYTELNLRPYWHMATSELLSTLAKRATILRKLDMSWCGCTVQTVSPTEFKKFIQQRGETLTHLRLNSAKFLNASCIETIGIVCDNLKELSLRNCCTNPILLNFSCLANLKNLERLDLFQTIIEAELLLTMLENNPKLKHLNLAFCDVSISMDTVALYISQYNRQLVTLDMWKSHFLTAEGLLSLSKCHDLEEVDFSWCLREAVLGDGLKEFLTNCPKLRKLFLAAVRGLVDRDLELIANLCPNLEQLDLMGSLNISKERYIEILQRCNKLQLLDLSFCDDIMEYDVELWSQTFNVNIKYSHIPNDSR